MSRRVKIVNPLLAEESKRRGNVMSVNVKRLIAAAAGVAALFAASAASAGCGLCGFQPPPAPVVYVPPPAPAPCSPCAQHYVPPPVVGCSPCGAPVYYRPVATCSSCGIGYGTDYMVNQGPVYSGPGVIAPAPTYAPTPTASGYPYVPGQYYEDDADEVNYGYPTTPRYYRPARVRPYAVDYPVRGRRIVNTRYGIPAKRFTPHVVRARAPVRFQGRNGLDIHLQR
jgi:hypothetical protein